MSMEGIGKWYLFSQKWHINGSGVGPPGGASPYETLLSTPLPFGSNLGMAKSLFGEP